MKESDLKIVFIEDVPAEAAMVEAALRRDGMDFSLRRVDTRDSFLKELAEETPDVILSDHGLPAFNGLAALEIAHREVPEIPFIFVTNALTRDMEIEKLAPGVTDYVQKKHLNLLAPTIRRALEYAEERRAAYAIPAERERIIARLLSLLGEYGAEGIYVPICAGCKRIRDKQNIWHPPEVFFRDRLGLEFTHGMCPECSEIFYPSEPGSNQ